MANKAYFLINVDEEYLVDRCQAIVHDLETIPEVMSIEQIKDTFNILVGVYAEMRVIFVAHKIMTKNWCKHLQIMKVVPFTDVELKGVNTNSLITNRSFVSA